MPAFLTSFNKAPAEARESPPWSWPVPRPWLAALQQSPRRSEGVTGIPPAHRRQADGLQQSPRRSEGVTTRYAHCYWTNPTPSTKPPQKRGSHEVTTDCAPGAPRLQQSPRRSEGVTHQPHARRGATGTPSTKPPQKRGSHWVGRGFTPKREALQQSPRRSEGVTGEARAIAERLMRPSTKPPQKRGSHSPHRKPSSTANLKTVCERSKQLAMASL